MSIGTAAGDRTYAEEEEEEEFYRHTLKGQNHCLR